MLLELAPRNFSAGSGKKHTGLFGEGQFGVTHYKMEFWDSGLTLSLARLSDWN